MHAHKVIDALTGTRSGLHLAIPNVSPAMREPFLAWMSTTASTISDAQHFTFENVPITPDGEGGFDLPGCTEEEQNIFSEGLLPVPFPVCWFEVPTADSGETLCYLLEETDDGFAATPFRLVPVEGGAVQFAGDRWRIHRGVPGASPPTIDISDRFGGLRLFQAQAAELGLPIDMETQAKGEVGLLIYLLLMLSSRTTEIGVVAAPERLNRSRAKKGKASIPAHRTVSIVPRRLAAEMRREEGQDRGDKHVRASPRLHWRRSHVRTLESGKRMVIPRALVGYREVGDDEVVTHDYRVRL